MTCYMRHMDWLFDGLALQSDKTNRRRVDTALRDLLGFDAEAHCPEIWAAIKALPDDAVRDLKREGYDARTFWEKLKQTGPAEILTVEGDDGERIQVWIE